MIVEVMEVVEVLHFELEATMVMNLVGNQVVIEEIAYLELVLLKTMEALNPVAIEEVLQMVFPLWKLLKMMNLLAIEEVFHFE